MIGQAIPQDNRIAHKIMEQSKQVKYCFNLPNNAPMLCFNKLTGESNAKKFSFCGNISLRNCLFLIILMCTPTYLTWISKCANVGYLNHLVTTFGCRMMIVTCIST